MRMPLLFLALAATMGVPAAERALRPVPLRDVRVTGWIGAKMDNLLRERVLSDWAQNEMMKECEDVFDTKTDGDDVRGSWQGEYWGKTMLGFVRVAEYTGDCRLLDFIRASAHRMMAKQRPDGYLGTYRDPLFLTNDQKQVVAKYGKEDDCNWNVWCRVFTAWGLCEAGRVTGDRAIVDAAAQSLGQLIDLLHANGIDIAETGSNAGLPSCTAIRPALALYRETGERKFLDFANEIVVKWDRAEDVPPNFFRHVGSGKGVYRWFEGRADVPWNWPKANEMTSCLEGLVEHGLATDARRSLDTAVRMHALLLEHELNPIFSVGYNDTFHDAASIPTGASEPCDVMLWMMFSHDLYLATGEARYLDAMELTYLNAFLAGVDRDGKWGARLVRSHARHLSAPPQAKMRHSHCCVNNLPRGFMDVAETTLAKDRDGAYRLAFYTDAKAKMDGLEVEIVGNWPVGDVAHVKVAAARPVTMRFRIPAWSKTTSVDGKDVSAADGWWRTTVPAGERTFDFAFDLSPRFVMSARAPDLENALRPEVIHRWFPGSPDLAPYYLTRPLPRLMRGPLLLAKTMRLGATEGAVFYWDRFDPKSWSCRLTPVDSGGVTWGSWNAAFSSQLPSERNRRFAVTVCDFQSAADRAERGTEKTFSIFY